MKAYIKKNTELRKKAINIFEKDFYKLMDNLVFGRTMMNARKNVDIRLVLDPIKYTKFVSKSNYKYSTFFTKDLAVVHFRKIEVKFNQPVYIGMSILHISKTLMYDFYYNNLKAKYREIK